MGDIHDKTSPGQGGVEQLFVFSLVQDDMGSWKHQPSDARDTG